MNRNSSRICGRKMTTEPTPFQIPSITSDRRMPFGNPLRDHRARSGYQVVDSVHQRRGAGEDRLKHRDDNGDKDHRSPEGMQEDRHPDAGSNSKEPGPDMLPSNRRAPPIAGTSAHPAAQASSTRGAAGCAVAVEPSRKRKTLSTPSPLAALIIATGAPSSLESAAGSTSPPRPRRSSAMFSTTSVGRFEFQDGCGEDQMTAEIGGVEDKKDGVRLVDTRHRCLSAHRG